jgi:hypothetical protein
MYNNTAQNVEMDKNRLDQRLFVSTGLSTVERTLVLYWQVTHMPQSRLLIFIIDCESTFEKNLLSGRVIMSVFMQSNNSVFLLGNTPKM